MSIRIAPLLWAALAFLPGAADARRVAGPSTGLSAIHFAQPPPDFPISSSPDVRRLRELVGRPVVINFWASWCDPCRAEIGALAEIQKTFGARVALVAVSQDREEGVAAAYLRAHDVEGAISVDDPDRAIFGLYSIVPIPTTLVLAADGSVTHVSIGALDWDELHAAIDDALARGLTPPRAFGTVGGNAGTP